MPNNYNAPPGLDSFAALVVVRHLRRMAAAGAAVVASIHQPRAAIWAVFDRVLVLAAGRMMYEGPCGGVVPWFSGRLGYPYDPGGRGACSEKSTTRTLTGVTPN